MSLISTNLYECGIKECGDKTLIVESIFEKLNLIFKHKFRIFYSMAVIFYLSFHVLFYFRVIRNL